MISSMHENAANPPPDWIIPVPRFWTCLEVPIKFMKEENPPEVVVRSSNSILIIYGYADASRGGFGNSLLIKGELKYRIGTWVSDEGGNLSNWRELENLVSSMEDAGKKGWLWGATVLLATDNEVAERALYKGNSTDLKLFYLVVRLKKLELIFGCSLLITHAAGTRMIAQGTNGISRGSLNAGVSIGESMLDHCPWARTALEVLPTLHSCLEEWTGQKLKVLKPLDWFEAGHDIIRWKGSPSGMKHPIIKPGAYIWAPTPTSADVCLEQL